jgi:hypothetical protein
MDGGERARRERGHDADGWEAPAGQPSRIVFVSASERRLEDAGAQTELMATTSTATCATPPSTIDSAWRAESTIAWVRSLGNDAWRVVSAPNQENAPLTVVMTCSTGATPSQLDILANFDVIVQQARLDDGVTFSIDIVAYYIDATTKQ